MRRVLMTSVLAVAAASAAQAAPGRSADEQAIVAAEKAWGGAFVSGDIAAIERLVADDFRGVDSSGAIYDKSAMLADVRRGPPLTSNETRVFNVRFFGDTAVAIGEDAEVGAAPERRKIHHVWTDTWVRQGERWRVVAAEDMSVVR